MYGSRSLSLPPPVTSPMRSSAHKLVVRMKFSPAGQGRGVEHDRQARRHIPQLPHQRLRGAGKALHVLSIPGVGDVRVDRRPRRVKHGACETADDHRTAHARRRAAGSGIRDPSPDQLAATCLPQHRDHVAHSPVDRTAQLIPDQRAVNIALEVLDGGSGSMPASSHRSAPVPVPSAIAAYAP